MTTSANIKKTSIKLTSEKRAVISDCFVLFVNWLKKQKLKDFNHRSDVTFEAFHLDDTMKVDAKKALHFNIDFLKQCSVDYFITVILHEAYHFYINNIPNKRDATRVKDFYYNQMMLHIDVEADFYVAKFFKENFHIDHKDFLNLYYSGANAFRDEEIRPLKFERFICSMLTIAHLFEHDELAIYRITPEAVRIFKNKPRAILHKTGYSETKLVDLTHNDLNELQKLYHSPNNFKVKNYVEKLHKILFRAVDGHKKKLVSPKLKFKHRKRVRKIVKNPSKNTDKT